MAETRRVVVIGTGPAGAAAAVFLSRAGLEPLVLESGSAKPNLGFTARVRGVTLLKHKPPLGVRGDVTPIADPAAILFEKLAPGGLSNHWACAVPRFSPDDFADAARGGEACAWPLGYDDLAPFYDRVEPLLRISGSPGDVTALPAGRVAAARRIGPSWRAVVDAAAARGRDVVAMPYAFGAESTLTRAATPFNAYTRLIEPIEQGRGLSVRRSSHVVRLIWSDAERRVVCVVVRDPGTGAETRIPCRAVVLAAGAVSSAQILLESSSPTFPDGLGNLHGVLGRYLHDHPLAKLVIDLRTPLELTPASYVTRPALERTAPLYAAAFMQWAGALELARSAVTARPGLTRQLGFSVFGTMPPVPENFVALERGRSGVNGRSHLLLALRHPRAALELLRDAQRELVEIFEEADLGPRVHVMNIEPPGGSVHYGGTCRMHVSPRLGVVDRDCRVHGVPNVVVADSAVFTTGPEKNPVLTAMALAARASVRLAEDLRSGDL